MNNRFIKNAGVGSVKFGEYLGTFFLVILFYIGGGAITALLLGNNYLKYTPEISSRFPYPLYFTLVMLPFITATLGLFLFIRIFHKRSFSSLVYPSNERFRWKNFLFGIFVTSILLGLSDVYYAIAHPEEYIFQFTPESFFPFLMVALILFPIQTLFEEVFIRGYINQGVGFSTQRSWAGLMVSSLIFGLLHGQNNEVSEFGVWPMLTVYTLMGFIFGLITLISEGVEITWGIHLVNNLYVALFKTFPGSSLETPAIFITTPPESNQILLETSLFSIVLLAIVLFKYRKVNFIKLLS